MEQILITSLFAESILIIFYKIKLVDLYEINKRNFMPDFCDFCFLFWVSVIINIFEGSNNYWIVFKLSLCSAVVSSYINSKINTVNFINTTPKKPKRNEQNNI